MDDAGRLHAEHEAGAYAIAPKGEVKRHESFEATLSAVALVGIIREQATIRRWLPVLIPGLSKGRDAHFPIATFEGEVPYVRAALGVFILGALSLLSMRTGGRKIMCLVVKIMCLVGNPMSLIFCRETIGRVMAEVHNALLPNAGGFSPLLDASALEDDLLAIYYVDALRSPVYAATGEVVNRSIRVACRRSRNAGGVVLVGS